MRRRFVFVPLGVAVLLLVVFGTGLQCILGTVTHVVDGDTFDVVADVPVGWGDDCPVAAGQEYRVRLIGVDTPEVYGRSECYGQEASDYVKNLLQDRVVCLMRDTSCTDRYDRLLAYVWVDTDPGNPGCELFLNRELVSQGYAKAKAYPPDTFFEQSFRVAECESYQAERGLWGACPGQSPPEGCCAPPLGAQALRIGVLAPLTGDLSEFGPGFINATRLAAKHINAAGGVLGQPVEIVTGDTGTSPAQAVAEARRLVEVEEVSAIVGAASSYVTQAVAESVTGPARIAQISPSATSPALTTVKDNDFLFRIIISDTAQGVVLGHLARLLGFNKVCTMYLNNPYGQGLSEWLARTFREDGGQVTAQVPHEYGQATYASELQTCTAVGPDALAAISYPVEAAVYLREALEMELIDQFLFVHGTKSVDMFTSLGWENFQGMYGTEHFFAPGTWAGSRLFDDLYAAEYGRRPGPFTRHYYDATVVIALAAGRACSVDPTAIRNTLREVTNAPGETVGPGSEGIARALQLARAGADTDYRGASGPLEFDANGDTPVGFIEIWKIQGQRIVSVGYVQVDLRTGQLTAVP